MSNTVKKLVVILGLMMAVTVSVSASPKRQAQPGVSGQIVDAATKLPEPYVTYVIKSTDAPEDAAPYKMTITDENGFFNEPMQDGEYTITFSSLGKKDLARTIKIQGALLDLGIIEMEDDVESLKEATVTALRPLVKMEVDKMTYNVEDDVDSKSMTMLDMLRKVPMVTVDAQDNITVNGSSSFKVYVDGKPNQMLSSNPSQIFKMMPANAFKSVEVITNPGAKYDAEGVGGVLNLITDKSSGQKAIQDGYNGTVSAEVDSKGDLNGGLFLTGQKGKFSFSANINGVSQRMNGISVETSIKNLDASGNVVSDLQTTAVNDQHGPGAYSDVSASYEIDSLRLLTATLGVMDFHNFELSDQTNVMNGPTGAALFNYDSNTDSRYRFANYRAGLDYQRSFADVEGRALTASYLFSTRPTLSDSYAYYNGYDTDRHSSSPEKMVEQTAQLDYTTPWGEGGSFSTGAKFISRANSSNSEYFLKSGDDWVKNDAGSTSFQHYNSIVGAYGEYTLSREKWSGKAGIRYEHTFQDVHYETGAGSDFKLDYGDFVPSASVQYNLSQMSNIGLSYNLRISRPGIGYLNPYVDRSNIYAIRYGNKDLETEKSHNIGLVWNFFSPVVMVNLTGRYSFCDNKIEEYSFFDSGVMHSTYGNIATEHNYGLNAFINVNLGQKTRIYTNMGGGYVDLTSTARGLRGGGWQFNTFTGVQHTLPWDLRLSANFMYNSRQHILDGYMDGICALMGGITKTFFEDKLSIGITGVTGFGKGGSISVARHTQGSDYMTDFNVSVPLARVGINLSYRFGNSQNVSVKKTNRSIHNDDVMQKSSGGTNTGMSSGEGI